MKLHLSLGLKKVIRIHPYPQIKKIGKLHLNGVNRRLEREKKGAQQKDAKFLRHTQASTVSCSPHSKLKKVPMPILRHIGKKLDYQKK